MTTNRDDSETSRFDRLDVEGFTLYDGKDATRHFERDHDLDVKTKTALGSGDQRAVSSSRSASTRTIATW